MLLVADRIYYLAYAKCYPRLQIFERGGFTDSEFEIFNRFLEKFDPKDSKRWCCQIPCTGYCHGDLSGFVPGSMFEDIYVLEPKENIEIDKVMIVAYWNKPEEIYFNEDAENYFGEYSENCSEVPEDSPYGQWSWFADAYCYSTEASLDLYYFNTIFGRTFSTKIDKIDKIVDKCNQIKGEKIVTIIPSGERAVWRKWKVYTELGEEFEHEVKGIPDCEFYSKSENWEKFREHAGLLECIDVNGFVCEKDGKYNFIANSGLYPHAINVLDDFTFCPYVITEKIDADMLKSSNEVNITLIHRHEDTPTEIDYNFA